MKGKPIDQIVYKELYPAKKQGDPQDFHCFLQRSLILEVRQEVHSFYGHLDTPEAKYPGLDYCHPTHRLRLGRWPGHKRLFDAFDSLRLTPHEISSLTKWEGTKWAKERFEREQGYQIRDSTADVIDGPSTAAAAAAAAAEADDQSTSDIGPTPRAESVEGDEVNMAMDEDIGEDEDDDEDESMQSIAPVMYRRLIEQAQMRENGGSTAIIDEEWDQWFKNVVESGELASIVMSVLRRPGAAGSLGSDSNSSLRDVPPARLFPRSMVETALANRWNEIPDFLHDVLQYALEVEAAAGEGGDGRASQTRPTEEGVEGGASSSSSSARQAPPTSASQRLRHDSWSYRRSFSDLRLPSSSQRAAAPPPGA